jgi:hypothetical protein
VERERGNTWVRIIDKADAKQKNITRVWRIAYAYERKQKCRKAVEFVIRGLRVALKVRRFLVLVLLVNDATHIRGMMRSAHRRGRKICKDFITNLPYS